MRVLDIIGPTTDASSEEALIQPPLAANDDREGLVAVKRKNRRRKAWGADLRTNTITSLICWDDYQAGREAWHRSWKRGLGLDCMVTIRPVDFAFLTPEERYKTTKGYLRDFPEFYRANDNLPEHAYLYSSEAGRHGRAHPRPAAIRRPYPGRQRLHGKEVSGAA